MTLYLTFDALDSGQLRLDQKLPISRKAQNTPPGKLGVKRGDYITVDQAARDMAKLAMAHLNNHRRYYHYFGQTRFRYKGKTYKNTNGLLHWLAGVDGFKTGFTRASGYNLVVSAKRDGLLRLFNLLASPPVKTVKSCARLCRKNPKHALYRRRYQPP